MLKKDIIKRRLVYLARRPKKILFTARERRLKQERKLSYKLGEIGKSIQRKRVHTQAERIREQRRQKKMYDEMLRKEREKNIRRKLRSKVMKKVRPQRKKVRWL